MSLWKRFFGKKPFRRYPDSFTLSKETKLTTLCQWVHQQATPENVVLVLCHFPATFLVNQQAMQQTGIDYEILADPLSETGLVNLIDQQKNGRRPLVLLSMAQMLRADKPAAGQIPIPSLKLAVIVTERYPLVACDEQLEMFMKQTGLSVSLGYLLSFDDAVLNHLLGERFVELMKQLGLGENHLVSSVMTDRALSRHLKKATDSIVHEQRAESAEEWIRLNLT